MPSYMHLDEANQDLVQRQLALRYGVTQFAARKFLEEFTEYKLEDIMVKTDTEEWAKHFREIVHGRKE